MIAQSVSTHQRFRRYGEHCQICGGHSGMKQGRGERCAGFLSDDGEYVFCSRPEYAGDLELFEKTTPATYCHKLYGACDCGKEHNPACPSSKGHGKNKKSDVFSFDDHRVAAYYPYYDERGNLLFVAVRYEWPDAENPKGYSKTYRPFQKVKGKWVQGLANIRRVPYRLPDLTSADPRKPVCIVEGERKVEALHKLGFVATCNVGGALKWQKEDSRYLKGRYVVILPDNDEAGEKHAADVVSKVQGEASDVRIVNLPGLPEKGDIIDWLASGGTREQLEELIKPPKRKFTYALEIKEEPIEWLWEGRLAKGEFTLGVGDAGIGKGLTCAAIIAMMTKIGGVILMSPEDSPSRTIVPRLKAAGADLSRVILLNEIDETDPTTSETYSRPVSFPEDTPILREAMEEVGAVLVVIDPILSMLSDRVDAYKNHAVRRAMAQVMKTAEKCNCAVLGIMHTTKSQHPNVLFRSSSSSAFIEMARTSFFFVPDPDGEQGSSGVIVNYKNNLTKHAQSLRYAIHQNEKGIGYIEWCGESSYTREELLNQGTFNHKKSEQEDVIVSVLKKNGEAMSVEEIWPHTSQTLSALKMMLSRKVEEGLVMRVARGKYTHAGNPLYAENGVTNVTNVTPVTNVTNVTNEESEKTSAFAPDTASLKQRERESNIVTFDVTSTSEPVRGESCEQKNKREQESNIVTSDVTHHKVPEPTREAVRDESNKSNITYVLSVSQFDLPNDEPPVWRKMTFRQRMVGKLCDYDIPRGDAETIVASAINDPAFAGISRLWNRRIASYSHQMETALWRVVSKLAAEWARTDCSE